MKIEVTKTNVIFRCESVSDCTKLADLHNSIYDGKEHCDFLLNNIGLIDTLLINYEQNTNITE
jgi:hypothetical protein